MLHDGKLLGVAAVEDSLHILHSSIRLINLRSTHFIHQKKVFDEPYLGVIVVEVSVRAR
jgi:hypothetical protein